MSVTIPVSMVRQALYRVAEGADFSGEGTPSTALLGRWFHEGMQFLLGDGSRKSPLTQLAELDADVELWKQSLVSTVYAQFVGPRLTRQQATLHGEAAHVVAFWEAIQAACHWLAELSWSLRSERPSRRGQPMLLWQSVADWFSTEESLACELREPGWRDSVRLVGIADAVVRLAHTGAWCAIEFKLGKTSPAADLGQACLYHLMLADAEAKRGSAGGRADQGSEALALISFRPARHEQLFTAAELASAKQRLIDLIGKLANVVEEDRGRGPASASAPSPPESVADSAAHPTKSEPKVSTVAPEALSPSHIELGRGIVRTFAEYDVTVRLAEPIVVGPTFIRFPIEPGRGVKRSSVERFAPELEFRLHLDAKPLVSYDEGQLAIDVQNPERKTVWFDDIRGDLKPPAGPVGGSLVPVGVDLQRRLICANLASPEHAHLLVVGTTGSGKSEWLRLAVAGLIATNTPDTVRFLVIDPKRNAFHALRESPYLWKPLVFPDEHSTVDILISLVEEMDRRYRMFDGVDAFHQLAAKLNKPLPRIVCICDEYRDLICRDRKERKHIEAQICRLGAKARAAGIHLILATQEARRDTITGPLDSNMPARVGLKMGKDVESRMLLGESGAEKLLGYGDLLFKDVGDPRRLQAPLLSEANRQELFGG